MTPTLDAPTWGQRLAMLDAGAALIEVSTPVFVTPGAPVALSSIGHAVQAFRDEIYKRFMHELPREDIAVTVRRVDDATYRVDCRFREGWFHRGN